jgi:phosphoribosylanthranilate isomerase
LNFVPESPRYIGGLEAARQLIEDSDIPEMRWAGVFVNASAKVIQEAVITLNLQIVQLHGDELPDFVFTLKTALGMDTLVWKALGAATKEDLAILPDYDCDGFVIDAKVPGVRGGSGQTFDWRILEGIDRSVPLILSGGLKPSNIAEAVKIVQPDWVDVASGVEISAGIKSNALMEEFVQNVNQKNPR